MSKLCLVAFVSLIVAISGQDENAANDLECQNQWGLWTKRFNKKYSCDEEKQTRFENFRNNWNMIKEHNNRITAFANGDDNECAHDLGLNKFADMDPDTFNQVMNGARPPAGFRVRRGPVRAQRSRALLGGARSMMNSTNAAPASIDWNQKGMVTPVKDQGSCGSCYAFSAIGALESQILLKNGGRMDLAEQQLVDCSTGYGNHGCDGGWMDQCFEYIIDNGGIEGEYSYPYHAQQEQCSYSSSYRKASMISYQDIQQNENALMNAVAQYGPISVAVDASRWQFYKGAQQPVFYDPQCTSQLNHAVLVTGYGTTNDGIPYWIIKNSWGTGWGMNGYIWLRRGINHCGVANAPTRPIYQ